jgi:hypothetical protein
MRGFPGGGWAHVGRVSECVYFSGTWWVGSGSSYYKAIVNVLDFYVPFRRASRPVAIEKSIAQSKGCAG